MANVLMFSYWPVFTRDGMACSVGLRVWGLARALAARGHQVRIAEPQDDQSVLSETACIDGLQRVGYRWGDPRTTRRMIADADVVYTQATPTMWSHFVWSQPRSLVVDLYAPILLEGSSMLERTPMGLEGHVRIVACLLFFLRHGDTFLCAGERQRDYYLGALAAAGRLNPLTDPNELLRIVPMGTEMDPPAVPGERLLRGRWVPEDAEIILWPGGIYPWFDGLTPIRALAHLRRERPRATLLFVGAENPLAAPMSAPGVATAASEAARLGLPPDAVRFAPWLPHEHRAAMYLESDLAVTAHKPLLEAEFSWRTRTLDCLWGGLPMVLTAGDELGDMAATAGAAVCVPPGNATAMAAALASLLAAPERREEMRAAGRLLAAGALSCAQVAEPLHRFCQDPRPAPDRASPTSLRALDRSIAPRPPEWDPRLRVLARKIYGSLRHRGVAGAARRCISELLSRARLVPPLQEPRP